MQSNFQEIIDDRWVLFFLENREDKEVSEFEGMNVGSEERLGRKAR